MTKKNPDFEQALVELEQLVDKMEAGDLKLEQALEHFERGIKLSRQCQQALEQAEQKVQELTLQQGELVTREIEPPAES